MVIRRVGPKAFPGARFGLKEWVLNVLNCTLNPIPRPIPRPIIFMSYPNFGGLVKTGWVLVRSSVGIFLASYLFLSQYNVPQNL